MLTLLLYFSVMKAWGDSDNDQKINSTEVQAFLANEDAFKAMTGCLPTKVVISKVIALVKGYENGNDATIIELDELKAIKKSGFCNCLC